jgi:hypothetical protein
MESFFANVFALTPALSLRERVEEDRLNGKRD